MDVSLSLYVHKEPVRLENRSDDILERETRATFCCMDIRLFHTHVVPPNDMARVVV